MAEHLHPQGGTTYVDARERYRLDTRVATGGMGEVWRATDTVLDRPVAVKLLKQEHADDSVFRSRFETEAHNAAGGGSNGNSGQGSGSGSATDPGHGKHGEGNQ